MRKPIMAGNWKMNKTRDEALQFIYAVNKSLPNNELVDTVVCAPAIILRDLVKRKGDDLRIGAQNMHFDDNGAYTGEISPIMLQTTGVEYVIIGHSERRAMFGETDETVNLKLLAALRHNLNPIVCVGETLEERENNLTNTTLERQVLKSLKGIPALDVPSIVFAYEPVWAIGTGKTASAQIAEDACLYIRELIAKLYNKAISEEVRIQYGGSVKPSNIDEFMAMPDIDGALVGGAGLESESFIKLCEACVVEKK